MRARGNGGHLELSTKFRKRFLNIWRRSLLVPSPHWKCLLVHSCYLVRQSCLQCLWLWKNLDGKLSRNFVHSSTVIVVSGQIMSSDNDTWHRGRGGSRWWAGHMLKCPVMTLYIEDTGGHWRPHAVTPLSMEVLAWWVEQLSWFPAVFILCCCMKYFSNVVTLARRPCSRSPDMHPPHCLVTCNFWLNNIMDCC